MMKAAGTRLGPLFSNLLTAWTSHQTESRHGHDDLNPSLARYFWRTR